MNLNGVRNQVKLNRFFFKERELQKEKQILILCIFKKNTKTGGIDFNKQFLNEYFSIIPCDFL